MVSTEGISGLLDGQGPVFDVEPPARLDLTNRAGGRLECSARGIPPPSILWVLGDGSPLTSYTNLRYQLPNGTLMFSPFSSSQFRKDIHRTSYRCVVTNSLGRILSREVSLRAGKYINTNADISQIYELTSIVNCYLLTK